LEAVSEKTIEEYKRDILKYVPDRMMDRPIIDITESDLREWIVNTVLPAKPKVERFKHLIGYVKGVFEYACDKQYIADNPAGRIRVKSYVSRCAHDDRTDEELFFTSNETKLLQADFKANENNPRALIGLLSSYTGMRAGELTALHKEDVIPGDSIYIHRQQKKNVDGADEIFYEADFTKNNRMRSDPGREFPITPEIQEILDKAMQLPGESVYLFHDADGSWISKDSYERYLRRHCYKLGFGSKSNNHCFRKGLNINTLIPAGFSAAERAELLGHTVRTNEQYYSLRVKVSNNEARKRIESFTMPDRLPTAT